MEIESEREMLDVGKLLSLGSVKAFPHIATAVSPKEIMKEKKSCCGYSLSSLGDCVILWKPFDGHKTSTEHPMKERRKGAQGLIVRPLASS